MRLLAIAMALVAVTWASIAFLITGCGLLFRRLCGLRADSVGVYFDCFYLGFAINLGLLLLLHLIMPIDWRVTAMLTVIGLAGWAAARWGRLVAFRRRPNPDKTMMGLAIICGLWFVNLALQSPQYFDSGNYHLTAIRWNHAYPVVPGLANLDTHLGFNNSSLLYDAALEVGFWQGRASHIANGVLLLVLTLACLFCAVHAWRSRGATSVSYLFLTGLAAVVTAMSVDQAYAFYNPGTDLPAAVLEFVIAYCLIRLAETNKSLSAPEVRFRVLSIAVLCSAAVTVKLSAVYFAVTALFGSVVLFLARDVDSRRFKVSVCAACAAIALAFGVAWGATSAVLSGYPFFPVTAFPLPVSWRLPIQYAEGAQWAIVMFARTGYFETISAEGLQWVPNWFTHILHGSRSWGLVPIGLALLGLAGLLWCRLRPMANERPPIISPVVFLPSLIAIPAWFLTAPAFRFGTALLWIFAALVVAVAINRVALRKAPRSVTASLIGLFLLPVATLFAGLHLAAEYSKLPLTKAAKGVLWVPPGSDHGFHPLYRPQLREEKSFWGVTYYVPAARWNEGSKWKDWVIWDCPLPGSPRENADLDRRGPSISYGFILREPPSSWPETQRSEVARVFSLLNHNIRRTADHFQVTPKVVKQALGTEAVHGLSAR